MAVENITTREQLMAFVERTGMTRWHEPDESGVNAIPAVGLRFDSAFCDPATFTVPTDKQVMASWAAHDPNSTRPEHGVFLLHDGKPVAFVNLAMLFAFATGMTE